MPCGSDPEQYCRLQSRADSVVLLGNKSRLHCMRACHGFAMPLCSSVRVPTLSQWVTLTPAPIPTPTLKAYQGPDGPMGVLEYYSFTGSKWAYLGYNACFLVVYTAIAYFALRYVRYVRR